MKKVDEQRWLAPEAEEAKKKIQNSLWFGGKILPEDSPFGIDDGRGDLAGLQVPNEQQIRRCIVRNINLSGASFQDDWIEECIFENVIFDAAQLMCIKDHDNRFINCSFVKTDLRGAGIGYRGSTYKKCLFNRATFHRAVFSRGEFDDCVFSDCKLGGVDFNASSFVNCEFKGKIRNVWFRGGYGYPNDEAEFGKARRNEMKNVSFADASLWNMTFSNHCDLSTIIIPKEGNYKLFDRWKTRLEHLAEFAEHLSEHDKYEASIFAKAYLIGAAKQESCLINCDEVIQKYGQELGTKIIEALSEIE